MSAGGHRASGLHRGVVIGLWASALVALALGWRYLAPPQVGGATTYVTTVGSSMEPVLHDGDLVMVRSAESYGVGDIVAYRSRALGEVVLHRIIAVDGDRFVTQGDANSWMDAERPDADQLLGAMAWRLPGAGDRIAWMRTPSGIAVIVAATTLILGMGAFGRRRSRRARHPEPDFPLPPASVVNGAGTNGNGHAPTNGSAPSNGRGPRVPDRSHRAVPRGASSAIAVLSVALIASSALAVFAFARPETANVERPVTYEQQGAFSYAAEAEGDKAVYGPDGLTTGDPVYLRLADSLEVAFDYALDSSAPISGSGTIGLSATIFDADGWERVFEIAPPAAFEGGQGRAAGTLDLARLRALVRDLQRATGVERDSYSVSVQAGVQGEADLSGRAVELTFEPVLPFVLTELELQLSPGETGIDELIEPVGGGPVTVSRPAPNDLPLFGLDVPPRTFRSVAVGIAVTTLLSLAVLWLVLRRLGRRAEHERIASRYGRLLVSVDPTADEALARAIEVDSIETLMLLAGHYDQVVLHGERDGGHTYFFRDNGATYRYRVQAPPPELHPAGSG